MQQRIMRWGHPGEAGPVARVLTHSRIRHTDRVEAMMTKAEARALWPQPEEHEQPSELEGSGNLRRGQRPCRDTLISDLWLLEPRANMLLSFLSPPVSDGFVYSRHRIPIQEASRPWFRPESDNDSCVASGKSPCLSESLRPPPPSPETGTRQVPCCSHEPLC